MNVQIMPINNMVDEKFSCEFNNMQLRLFFIVRKLPVN